MKYDKLAIVGALVLVLCVGWKIMCAIWSGLCWLADRFWSAICSFSSWIWSVVLIVLRCILAPAYWVAEGVCDGSGWAWCVGLAVEAIFVSFIVGAISRILKK